MTRKWMAALMVACWVVGLLARASGGVSAAPMAVTMYISDEYGPDNASNRTSVDTLDDSWRTAVLSAGASGFQQITLSGTTDEPKTIWSSGSFTIQVSNREMTAADISTSNSVGSTDGAYELSNSNTLQDDAPRPASLYNTSSQPLFWNQTGGSTATRNAVLFTFSQPIAAFGAWFGDLETHTDGSGVTAFVRLLDNSGNRIGSDITVTTSTSNQSSCGSTFAGCGNRTTKWIGFLADSSTLVKQMLVVVGDDDASGNALAERISYIGATIGLGAGGSPLAVALAAFTADITPAGVTLTWETVSEADNAGFRVWRAEAADGARALLAFVPAAAPGSTAGNGYSYVDTAAEPGRTYWYWLEDVDLSGATTLHGPVSAIYAGPNALRLVGFRGAPSAAPLIVTTAVVAGALLALAAVQRRRHGRA